MSPLAGTKHTLLRKGLQHVQFLSLLISVFFLDGQAIAIKLANQIDKVVNPMKQQLAILNGLMENAETVTFDDIKDPCGDIFVQVQSPTDVSNVPSSVKKKLVQLVCFQDRCKEEQDLVKQEMRRLTSFIIAQINFISSYLISDADVNRGLRSLLLQKAAVHKKRLNSLRSMFGDVVTLPPFGDSEETFLHYSEVEVEDDKDLEDVFDIGVLEELDIHSTPIRGWNDEDSD